MFALKVLVMCPVLFQPEEKVVKKEESRDEDDIEDDSSTANAEEYDPMDAEEADEDDDDGSTSFYVQAIRFLILVNEEKSCTTLTCDGQCFHII